MNRASWGNALRIAAAAGYLANAVWHTTGYRSVTELAAEGPPPLRPLVSALWLAFSAGLVVLGLVVAVAGRWGSPVARRVLLASAFFPLAAAGLQVCFLGFIPPTASLLGVAGLTLAAAGLLPPPGVQPPPGAP